MDGAGRVVLPKRVREALHLSAGDALELAVHEEEITLRPRRNHAPLRKKQGIWVFDGRARFAEGETEGLQRKLREERDRHVSGVEE